MKGIDVSYYQEGMNLSRVKRENGMTQSNDYIIPHYIYGITGFAAP